MILKKDYRLLFAKNRNEYNMTVLMYAAQHNCDYVIHVIADFIKHLYDKEWMNPMLHAEIENWVNSKENKNGDTAYILCCRKNKHVTTTMHALSRVHSFDFGIRNKKHKLGSHYITGDKTFAVMWEHCGIHTLFK